MFPPVRNFSILSAVAFVALAAISINAYQRHTSNTLLAMVERQNVATAGLIATTVRPSFGHDLATAKSSGSDALKPGQGTRALRDAMVRAAKSSPLLKVTLQNRNGLIVYSSQPGQAGQDKSQVSGFGNAFSSGQTVSRFSVSAATGRGDRTDIVESYIPLRNEAGELQGVLGLHRDAGMSVAAANASVRQFSIALISSLALLFGALIFALRYLTATLERQRQSLVTSENELRSELDKRVSEFEVANRELKDAQDKLAQSERLSDLGQLAATVSHEIRNPLSVIRNAIHVVREKVKMAGINLDRPLDRAGRAVTRCDDIVNDMLEHARSSELDKVVVDGSEYLNEILDEQALPADLTVIRELPVPGLEIAIDCDRFRRVIINLISNAAEAIKDGGIENGEIKVSCLPDDGNHAIHITNNGPAIPEEVQKRMFEPLYTTKSTGSGIGLPTVKKLVEQHGAELHVDSRDGAVTTWSIFFRADATEAINATTGMQADKEAMAA